jgi:hypothetical protein
LLVLAALSIGCSDGDRFGGDGGGPPPGDDGGRMPPPGRDGGNPPPPMGACTKMDILFVVDDSGSMAEEQSNLATNFVRFVEVIESFRSEDGTQLDYRIGVTTTGRPTTTIIQFPPAFPLPPMMIFEDGPNGALQQGSGCGLMRRWIEQADGDVASKFSCVAQVGTGGSSMEMPLLMLERALTDRVADGTNAGFLREDALLAVVVLTDEDDCSRTDDPITLTIPDPFTMPTAIIDECDPEAPELVPLDHFLSVYDTVKGDRGRWALAMIAGPGPGTCTSAFGDAIEGVRLRRFVDMAGENVTFSSICDGDLSGALMNALETFDAACQSFPPLI